VTETTSARTTFRRHVREQALAAAYELTVELGWERVRLNQVASRVGISRPTLYKEFGDKQGLGDALVLREAERFLAGIEHLLDQSHGSPGETIATAVAYTLEEAARSPLLMAVLVSPRLAAGGENLNSAAPGVSVPGVLPLVSTSATLLTVASERLVGWFSENFPGVDPADVAAATDAVVRLTVSHLVVRDGNSRQTGLHVAEVATRYLAHR